MYWDYWNYVGAEEFYSDSWPAARVDVREKNPKHRVTRKYWQNVGAMRQVRRLIVVSLRQTISPH